MSQREIIDEVVPYDGKCMVCETDIDGDITYVNRCFVKMTGFEKDEILSHGFELIRHPDVPQCLFTKMWEALKEKEDWKGYLKILTKEGKYFWTSIYITPKTDEAGRLTGYSAAYTEAEELMVENMSKLYAQAIESENCSDELYTDIAIANLAAH